MYACYNDVREAEIAVSGLDAAPASHNTAALANWFRAANINQVKLTPYGFHCQIGSRYALVTPDVRVLVAVVFCRRYKASRLVAASERERTSPASGHERRDLFAGHSGDCF